MKKKPVAFSGSLITSTPEIFLNIDDLKNGTYIIHLTLKEKIIKTVTFKKE